MIQAICRSYLLEVQQGIHQWGTDAMKLALYSGVLDPDFITAYTTNGEITGTGYAAGGLALTLAPGFPQLSPSGARRILWDFDDIVVNPAAFSWRSGLIYNASKANRAVAALDFGQTYTAASSAAIIWPEPTDNLAIIRSGA